MSEHATGAIPPEDELARLAAQMFDICAPRAWPAGAEELWKRNVRGLLARTFRLGMNAGWDKHHQLMMELEGHPHE